MKESLYNIGMEERHLSGAGVGFRYMDTLQMYYKDTGWTDYKLYEYAL